MGLDDSVKDRLKSRLRDECFRPKIKELVIANSGVCLLKEEHLLDRYQSDFIRCCHARFSFEHGCS
jgi:hypothetical protein